MESKNAAVHIVTYISWVQDCIWRAYYMWKWTKISTVVACSRKADGQHKKCDDLHISRYKLWYKMVWINSYYSPEKFFIWIIKSPEMTQVSTPNNFTTNHKIAINILTNICLTTILMQCKLNKIIRRDVYVPHHCLYHYYLSAQNKSVHFWPSYPIHKVRMSKRNCFVFQNGHLVAIFLSHHTQIQTFLRYYPLGCAVPIWNRLDHFWPR